MTANDNPTSHRMLLPSGQLFFLRVHHASRNQTDLGVYYCNATNPQTGVSAVSNEASLELAGMAASSAARGKNITFTFTFTFVIITSAKEVMFLADFVCLFVCLLAR